MVVIFNPNQPEIERPETDRGPSVVPITETVPDVVVQPAMIAFPTDTEGAVGTVEQSLSPTRAIDEDNVVRQIEAAASNSNPETALALLQQHPELRSRISTGALTIITAEETQDLESDCNHVSASSSQQVCTSKQGYEYGSLDPSSPEYISKLEATRRQDADQLARMEAGQAIINYRGIGNATAAEVNSAENMSTSMASGVTTEKLLAGNNISTIAQNAAHSTLVQNGENPAHLHEIRDIGRNLFAWNNGATIGGGSQVNAPQTVASGPSVGTGVMPT